MSSLVIDSIYESIQGESTKAGWPCVFVRTTGCPLRCRWCDTSYAFSGGNQMSLEEVIAKVNTFSTDLVELTGGEPLAQEASFDLCTRLVAQGKQVMIETSGSIDLGRLHQQVHVIMDIKCPDSGMDRHNHLANLDHLKPTDEIKFVVASHEDFLWSIDLIKNHQLDRRFTILISPAFALVKPKDLSQWILASGLRVKLNLQLHKFIWHPRAKNV